MPLRCRAHTHTVPGFKRAALGEGARARAPLSAKDASGRGRRPGVISAPLQTRLLLGFRGEFVRLRGEFFQEGGDARGDRLNLDRSGADEVLDKV